MGAVELPPGMLTFPYQIPGSNVNITLSVVNMESVWMAGRKVIGVNVTDETAERWSELAKAHGSVQALIAKLMDSEPARRSIVHNPMVRSIEVEDEAWSRWVTQADKRGMSIEAWITERMEYVSPPSSKNFVNIEILKADWKKERDAEQKALALRSLKRDPSLAVVEPSEDNTKLIAARVPSSGAHFPRTPTYWQKQQAKAKPAARGKSADARSEDEDI